MKHFNIGDKSYSVPDITVTGDSNNPVFEISEGDHKGVQFRIHDIRVDDEDAAVLWYELDTSAEMIVGQIKPIVDDFIIQIIYEQIERSNEDKTTE